jgi:hypothetical protein
MEWEVEEDMATYGKLGGPAAAEEFGLFEDGLGGFLLLVGRIAVLAEDALRFGRSREASASRKMAESSIGWAQDKKAPRLQRQGHKRRGHDVPAAARNLRYRALRGCGDEVECGLWKS